jgi:hypothetical protein
LRGGSHNYSAQHGDYSNQLASYVVAGTNRDPRNEESGSSGVTSARTLMSGPVVTALRAEEFPDRSE